MDISGTQQFTSSPQTVWDALHNSATLQSCIPGAQSVAWQGDNLLNATINMPGVGPIGGGTRTLAIQATESNPPSHLKFEIARGPVTANAVVDLAANGSGTTLTYTAHATLSGALGLADGLAKPMVENGLNQFFSKLQQQVG